MSDPRRYQRHLPPLPSPAPRRESTFYRWRDSRVHLERIGDPDAPVRLLLVHGAGGNAAAMWPYAAHMATLGARVSVPDLPGYGRTSTRRAGRIRYQHWHDLLADLVRAEADERPLIVMGASMGGMLAYDTAASTGLAAGLVATCLLDPREPAVRARMAWSPLLARLAGPGLRLLAGPLASLRVPIRWIADMRHIANEPGLVDAVIADPRGGGGRVPLGWMRSYLESAPVVEPEVFTVPTLLVHPAEDRWTPTELSVPFFERLAGPKQLVELEGCGHFPVEEPGLGQLLGAVREFVEQTRR